MQNDIVYFYQEIYKNLIDEYGFDNLFIAVTLGGLVAAIYLRGCKK